MMQESRQNIKVFSLSEVMLSVQQTLARRYGSDFWVKAEMNRLNFYPHSGHCYPDLLEKRDGKVVAQARANLWNRDYERINARFLEVLKDPLRDGIHILFRASIQFDPVYGFSLRILDIDPVWSLGELEREKQLTIEKLKKEGLFDLNRRMILPALPSRIAVISVETSKGYADFVKVIDGNPWNYAFFHMLFPALLQGEKAVPSIIHQLDRIRKVKHHFDAVALIRGGGGEVGLSCYNHYDLSAAVAAYPLPVLTGIGHSTNETVVEMIAHTNAITPTELADFLLQHFHNAALPLNEAVTFLKMRLPHLLGIRKRELMHHSKSFRSDAISVLRRKGMKLQHGMMLVQRSAVHQLKTHRYELHTLDKMLIPSAKKCLSAQDIMVRNSASALQQRLPLLIQKTETEIHHAEKSIRQMDPAAVLKRGYSLTLINGKAMKEPDQAPVDAIIETRLAGGRIWSRIVKK